MQCVVTFDSSNVCMCKSFIYSVFHIYVNVKNLKLYGQSIHFCVQYFHLSYINMCLNSYAAFFAVFEKLEKKNNVDPFGHSSIANVALLCTSC